MSLLQYNNISLPYSQLTNFVSEAVYDDLSETDQTVIRFSIGVQALITDDALDLLSAEMDAKKNTAGGLFNPADVMSYIHDSLMTPRKQLSFQFDGVEFIPGPAGVPGTVDAMNGPKPQSCTFTQLNNTTWIIQYRIVAHYRVHYKIDVKTGSVTYTNLPGNVCLYNRWEERADIDNCQFTTRTRRGKMMIRSDNDKGFVADQVRNQMAVLGLQPGFVREKSSYTQTPDGLGLAYEIVDREVFRMPPFPAYVADGVYEEEATKADGKRFGHVRVALKGKNETSQYALLDTAVAIAVGKLELAGANFLHSVDTQRGYLVGAKVSVNIWKNEVAVQMSCFIPIGHPKGNRRLYGTAFIKPSIASTPQADNGIVKAGVAGGATTSKQATPPVYYSRGTAGLLLQAAAYYDPNLAKTELSKTNNVTPDGDNFRIGAGNDVFSQGGNQLGTGLRPGEAGKTKET